MSQIHVHAPGRVNLIGEHTDQTGGLVLPLAIDRGVTIEGTRHPGIRLRSRLTGTTVDCDLAPGGGRPRAGWGRYVAAVSDELSALGRPPVGLDGVVESDLPTGAGLSSSAALTVAVAAALCQAARWTCPPLALAQACQRAERAAVGVPCGLMDPAAVMLARADHALLLDCTSLSTRDVPFPHEAALVVFDSGVPRRLEDTPYARRRAELEAAVTTLGDRRPADVPISELADLCAALDDGTVAGRLRHVVTENQRVRRVVELLDRPDPDLALVGRELVAGHTSLRDDLDVSVPALDHLVDVAVDEGAYGARLTGAGFGGAVIALVPTDRAGTLAEAVLARQRAAFDLAVAAFPVRPVAGVAQGLGWAA